MTPKVDRERPRPEVENAACQTWQMAANEAILAGGFALAGVAMQQAIAMLNERQRFKRDQAVRSINERHTAFVHLVASGRRVQRVLVDREANPQSERTAQRLAEELDKLTEAAVLVRLIVSDPGLLDAVERFEDHAKRLETASAPPLGHLKLTGLINEIQRVESTKSG